MLKLCLNFNESQPMFAYKQYAYKKSVAYRSFKFSFGGGIYMEGF